MNPIPVGLIGVGRHGSRYLHHLLTEKTGGTLVAFSRINQTEGRRLAQTHRLQYYPQWRDLLADPSIRAVIVAAPPTLNVPIALEALHKGKALLIEKPLALTPLQAQHMVETARQTGIPIMTAQTLRYEPVIQKLQELRASLGDWQYLSCTMRAENRPKQPDGWGAYGVLMEFGIHLLDWIRFLTQDEVESVSAKMERPSPNDPECRVWGSLTTSQGLSCLVDISRVTQGRVTRVEIIGTRGQACADWIQHHVTVTREGNRVTDYPCPSIPTLIPVLQDFFHALDTNAPMSVTGEDGLQAVRIAEACYQSSQSGHPVLLAPPH